MPHVARLRFVFDEIKSGIKEPEEFYKPIWELGVLLNRNQYSEVREMSEALSLKNDRSSGLHLLLEGLSLVYSLNSGNEFEILDEAIQRFEKVNDDSGIGAANVLKAIFFKNLGQLDKAQVSLQQSFGLIDENSIYNYFLLIGYYQAGEIHSMMKDYEIAIHFYNTAANFSNSKGTINTRALNALGTVYMELEEYDRAFEYLDAAKTEIQQTNNELLTSKIYADLANYYFKKAEYENVLHWQEKSIEIRTRLRLDNPLITNYTDLATLYLKLKDFDKALGYAFEAERLSEESKVVIKRYPVYKVLSEIHEAKGNFEEALNYFKKFQQLRDEVLSQENARKMKQLSLHHEMENIKREKEIFTLRNVELKSALDEIEASVRYAKRIQSTILPPERVIKKYLPEAFILYKPKDIVAGDFYWFEFKNNHLLFAAADCTGHGVPGAMVSVICNNSLNRNVHEKGITDPGELLNATRENIVREFEKSDDDVQDGMDISLCALRLDEESNYKNNDAILRWSGANNPLWLIRNNELIEFSPEKQPVGKFTHSKPFSTVEIPIQKNDIIYIFTDGFQDQFGGATENKSGKKFKAKRFKELLLSIHSNPLSKQKLILDNAFEKWKGDLEQVDDVCVIGVRL